jgi:transcriptional regulator NrdR family protein
LERVDLPSSLLFQRDAAHTEPFQRDKLFISIYEACKHRKHAVSAATALTDTVLGKARSKIDGATVTRSDIISVTSDILKHFDKAAYIAYIAYHPL